MTRQGRKQLYDWVYLGSDFIITDRLLNHALLIPAPSSDYELPEAKDISLIVHNPLGGEVVRLVGEYLEPGLDKMSLKDFIILTHQSPIRLILSLSFRMVVFLVNKMIVL